MNFWQKLKKDKKRPLVVLAPMADVTDFAFREMFAKYGKPDVFWTEFVSADGIVLAPQNNPDSKGFTGHDKIFADLKFSKKQRPIVAQIFGSNLENLEKASEICAEIGFDGIDINMGCPDRSIEKQKSGAAMMKNSELAISVIRAVKKGIENAGKNIPVSVKTRLGYNKDELEEWLPKLLLEKPALITIHARTRKEMSLVPARWERIKRAVEIRDEIQTNLPIEGRTLIFGNGDVLSAMDGLEKCRATGADGAMIGRGIFGNPWFFKDLKKIDNCETVDFKNGQKFLGSQIKLNKRLTTLVEHAKFFEKYVGHKNFAVMKKHFKAYAEGFDGAKELRNNLMKAQNSKEVSKIITSWLKTKNKI
jgi:nifR3 family TIM-barrel protein